LEVAAADSCFPEPESCLECRWALLAVSEWSAARFHSESPQALDLSELFPALGSLVWSRVSANLASFQASRFQASAPLFQGLGRQCQASAPLFQGLGRQCRMALYWAETMEP
jgi:hypothetical protein